MLFEIKCNKCGYVDTVDRFLLISLDRERGETMVKIVVKCPNCGTVERIMYVFDFAGLKRIEFDYR